LVALWCGVVVDAGGGFVEWSARACVSRCAGVVVLGLGAEIRRLRLRVVLAELEDSSEIHRTDVDDVEVAMRVLHKPVGSVRRV
jgi:hypothetical protein